MKMHGRRSLLLLGVGVVALLATASPAYGHTARAAFAPSTLSGPPTTRLSVAGTALQPGPVSIQWNTVNGETLATAVATPGPRGAQFSAEITVPDASPGAHYLLLVSDGRTLARSAFEVTPAAGTAPAAAAPATQAQLGPVTGEAGSSRSTPLPLAALLVPALAIVLAGATAPILLARRRAMADRRHL